MTECTRISYGTAQKRWGEAETAVISAREESIYYGKVKECLREQEQSDQSAE